MRLAVTSGGCGNLNATFPAVPPRPKKPDSRRLSVGDKIRVNLQRGFIEDAVVKAVIETTSGRKSGFGQDQTALIEKWQVVND